MIKKFTKQIRKILISSYVIFTVLIFNFPLTADAKTTITVEDCKIKVTVDIAITGDGASDDMANKIKQEAEKKWNYAHIKAGECKCELNLTINVIKVDSCTKP